MCRHVRCAPVRVGIGRATGARASPAAVQAADLECVKIGARAWVEGREQHIAPLDIAPEQLDLTCHDTAREAPASTQRAVRTGSCRSLMKFTFSCNEWLSSWPDRSPAMTAAVALGTTGACARHQTMSTRRERFHDAQGASPTSW
jgi:hypothetical protein